MPKIKTHKGTSKRIKKSATGKLMREKAFGNHLLSKKSASRKRVIARLHKVDDSDKNNVKQAIAS